MNSPDAFVWWSSHAKDRPPGGIPWLEISEDSFQETERRITGRHRLPGPVPDWADDLFRIARAAFLADKHIRRADMEDRWTRRIHLSIPVLDPDRWEAAAPLRHITALLQTLTSDLWDVQYRGLTKHQVEEAIPDLAAEQASDITLFSGGLDSLSWAASLAAADTSRPLLLVMFREIGLLRLQQQVYASVKRVAKSRDVLLLPMSQTPAGDGSGKRLETSSRTRGLLYMAGAIRAATAHSGTRVHVPENGQLALNPPLTPSRSAACSSSIRTPVDPASFESPSGWGQRGRGRSRGAQPAGTPDKGRGVPSRANRRTASLRPGSHPQLRQAPRPSQPRPATRQLRHLLPLSRTSLKPPASKRRRLHPVRSFSLDR